MKQKKHYTYKTFVGSACKKCLEWSNMPDGLKGYECKATKEQIKENKRLLANK